MGLQKYRQKRDLKKTPEPGGGKSAVPGKLAFVIQRHKASHLHYDFRLEMEGVLKSWAVPKGPSMDPSDKRLAMMVEDHPYDYKDFKGVIPAGNYGAGIVEIWDHGTYEPLEVAKGKDATNILLSQLRKGSLKFRMKGRKLKGEFALVRLRKADENSWLLIKHRDAYAIDGYDSEDQTPKSSPINKALAKEGKGKAKKRAVVKSSSKDTIERGSARTSKSASAEARPKATQRTKHYAKAAGAKVRGAMKPMLATLVQEPFDDADWIFEIKWDGYRAIAETGVKELRLYSRNGLSFKDAYPAVSEDLQRINRHMVLDGEITAMDDQGRPNFQLLQHASSEPDTALVYNVFDLLELDGKDLRNKTLAERKKLLKDALPSSDHVKYCDHVDARGKEFFAVAKEQDLEGVIAKRKDGRYLEGKRSSGWLKIKNHRSQEAVIGGWTAPRNSRKHFGALLLGVYEKGKLIYVGHTGTGFNAETLKELSALMKPLERKTSPFANTVDANSPATWITPKLVANIKFTEWTRDDHMRHPVFLGLRVDKDPKTVHREKASRPTTKAAAKPVHARAKKKATSGKRTPRTKKSTANSEPASGSSVNERNLKIGKNSLKLTSLSKVFWPEEGYTKGDVIDYYEKISPLILPYLKDRPESLYRTPNGITGIGFFQKDAGGDAPSWVSTLNIPSDSRGGENINYILCNDKATLLYLANLGSIELNPWTSRKQHLLKPDHIVMDLDPSKGNTFEDVVEAALAVKVVLDKVGVVGYCKTSGATGMHIYIPTGARYTYGQLAPLAQNIMRVVQELLPKSTTMVRSLSKRDKNKIYLDHLQNRKGQTLASVYSIRPKPGGTVSTPLEWDEVKSGLDPHDFTIRTIHNRIKKKGDLFAGVLGRPKFNLEKIQKELNELLE